MEQCARHHNAALGENGFVIPIRRLVTFPKWVGIEGPTVPECSLSSEAPVEHGDASRTTAPREQSVLPSTGGNGMVLSAGNGGCDMRGKWSLFTRELSHSNLRVRIRGQMQRARFHTVIRRLLVGGACCAAGLAATACGNQVFAQRANARSACGELAGFAGDWLTTFNSGDSAHVRRFIVRYQGDQNYPGPALDSALATTERMHGRIGSLDSIRTITCTATVLSMLLRSSDTGYWRVTVKRAIAPSRDRYDVDLGPAEDRPVLTGARGRARLTTASSGRPVVMVSVNGAAPAPFVIDIGTNVSLVAPRLLKKLVRRDSLPAVADAGQILFRTLRLGDVEYRAGALRIDDLGSDVDGLLGLDMFAEVLLTLDYPRSIVTIERGSLDAPRRGNHVVAYSLPRPGSPTIRFDLGGRTYNAVTDVGSTMPFAVPQSMMSMFSWMTAPVAGAIQSGRSSKLLEAPLVASTAPRALAN